MVVACQQYIKNIVYLPFVIVRTKLFRQESSEKSKETRKTMAAVTLEGAVVERTLNQVRYLDSHCHGTAALKCGDGLIGRCPDVTAATVIEQTTSSTCVGASGSASIGWGRSSVGRASDRHAADTGWGRSSVGRASDRHAADTGWGRSSVGRASDRHAADTGSIPRCGKGFFFSQSTFSADFLTVSVHPRVRSHPWCPYDPRRYGTDEMS